MKIWQIICLTLLLSSCATMPPTPVKPEPPTVIYQTSSWQSLPGWQQDDLASSISAWQESCRVLGKREGWQAACAALASLPDNDVNARRTYFETWFTPYQVEERDNRAQRTQDGLITGYYEPLLKGSLTKSAKAKYPVYGVPADLITVDLSTLYPELKSLRLRGRVEQQKLIPYYSRAEIETGKGPSPQDVLAWVDDPVELFFLQIQGSGRISLQDGSLLRVGYANQNGRPYKSIGKWLIAQKELRADQASMQGIQAWIRTHPDRLDQLLNVNPSYVFFRRLPQADGGPIGALGVPLTDQRSIAIDPRFIPLGSPVYLNTTAPESNTPLQRLMFAQDTGGAIRGAIRADFFWGFGDQAGELAGKMKQKGKLWVLLPKTVAPPVNVEVNPLAS